MGLGAKDPTTPHTSLSQARGVAPFPRGGPTRRLHLRGPVTSALLYLLRRSYLNGNGKLQGDGDELQVEQQQLGLRRRGVAATDWLPVEQRRVMDR